MEDQHTMLKRIAGIGFLLCLLAGIIAIPALATHQDLGQHCPDKDSSNKVEVGSEFGPTLEIAPGTVFCVKAGHHASGKLVMDESGSYTVTWLNNGGQTPGISYYITYDEEESTDSPTEPINPLAEPTEPTEPPTEEPSEAETLTPTPRPTTETEAEDSSCEELGTCDHTDLPREEEAETEEPVVAEENELKDPEPALATLPRTGPGDWIPMLVMGLASLLAGVTLLRVTRARA